MPAGQFGPKTLKAVRQEMVNMGWSRGYINRHVDRIKRMFKWAVAEEILPPHTYEGLRAVGGLRFGRSSAPERQPVRPVPAELVEPAKKLVSPPVAAMMELQLLTGARPGEIVIARPMDIDRSGPVWLYRPDRHKNQHHNLDRVVYIGPQAQQVLAPFLLRGPEEYCFSPTEAECKRRGQPTSKPSRRKAQPQWVPGEHYTRDSYRVAIARACRKAFPLPEPLARAHGETLEQWKQRLGKAGLEQVDRWRKTHHWHPHQLRHSYATYVRKEDNLEGAQILLGHSKADVTQIYAERDMEHAVRVAMKIG